MMTNDNDKVINDDDVGQLASDDDNDKSTSAAGIRCRAMEGRRAKKLPAGKITRLGNEERGITATMLPVVGGSSRTPDG